MPQELNRCIRRDGLDTFRDNCVPALLAHLLHGTLLQVKALVDRAQFSGPGMRLKLLLSRSRKGKRLAIFKRPGQNWPHVFEAPSVGQVLLQSTWDADIVTSW